MQLQALQFDYEAVVGLLCREFRYEFTGTLLVSLCLVCRILPLFLVVVILGFVFLRLLIRPLSWFSILFEQTLLLLVVIFNPTAEFLPSIASLNLVLLHFLHAFNRHPGIVVSPLLLPYLSKGCFLEGVLFALADVDVFRGLLGFFEDLLNGRVLLLNWSLLFFLWPF